MDSDFDTKPFNPETLAARWECSPQHIRDLVAGGQLAAFRVGRLIRIPANVVKDFECPNSESNSTEEHGTPSGAKLDAPKEFLSVPKIVRKPNVA